MTGNRIRYLTIGIFMLVCGIPPLWFSIDTDKYLALAALGGGLIGNATAIFIILAISHKGKQHGNTTT